MRSRLVGRAALVAGSVAAVLAGTALASGSAAASPQGRAGGGQRAQIRHVLLISVDGLHQQDLAWYVRNYPHSVLASLDRTTVDAELDGPVALDGVPGLHDVDREGPRLRCEVDNAALNEVLRRLTAAGVRTLTCRPPTLEELFLRQYASQDHDPERNRVTQAP